MLKGMASPINIFFKKNVRCKFQLQTNISSYRGHRIIATLLRGASEKLWFRLGGKLKIGTFKKETYLKHSSRDKSSSFWLLQYLSRSWLYRFLLSQHVNHHIDYTTLFQFKFNWTFQIFKVFLAYLNRNLSLYQNIGNSKYNTW